MFELTGTVKDLALDMKTGKAILTFVVNEKNDAMNCFNKFQECEKLTIKVDQHREKRSLNANNYAWALISKIADALRASKDDIYLKMLKHYGTSEVVSVVGHIPIERYVKYCEYFGESILKGKRFVHYKVFKGSSDFDSREMSIFIDGIVSEAQELGIQTKTPAEIANLKSLWGE